MLKHLDAVLNAMTMYKVVLTALLVIVGAAFGLSFFDLAGPTPAEIGLSVAVLSVAAYTSNTLFTRLFNAVASPESWLITALILVCILAPTSQPIELAFLALASVIAMASKYVLTWNGTHIFNPAAIAAFIVSIAGLVSASWWVATPYLLPVVAWVGFVILRKQRQIELFVLFALVAVAGIVYMNGVVHGQPLIDAARSALGSWPVVFLGAIMLTEPATLRGSRYYQFLTAVIVAVVFVSQVHIGPLYSSPQLALLIGNLFGLIVAGSFAAWLKVIRIEKHNREIVEVIMQKPAGLHFTAGQYMEFALAHKNSDIRGNRRMFSIASAPSESELRIALRLPSVRASSYKRALARLAPGSYIRGAHVRGSFTLDTGTQSVLFLAGGIGITPFASMVQELVLQKRARDIVLLYAVRGSDELLYASLWKQAASYGVQTHAITQHLTRDKLQDLVPDLIERTVYISGPSGFVDANTKLVTQAGVARTNIKTDHFTGY